MGGGGGGGSTTAPPRVPTPAPRHSAFVPWPPSTTGGRHGRGGGGGRVNGRPTTGVIAFPRVRLTWTRVASLPRARRPGADEGPPPTQRAHQLWRSTSSTLSDTSPTPRTEPTRAGAPQLVADGGVRLVRGPARVDARWLSHAPVPSFCCESCTLASSVSVGDLPTTASFVASPFPAQRRPWCGCLPPLSAPDLWPARRRCLR